MTRCTTTFLALGLLTSGSCLADGFDGIWRSNGYGQVLTIAGDDVTLYQEVAGHVLASNVEHVRRAGSRLELEIVPFAYRSTFAMARAGDMLALSEDDTGREILLERLDALPPPTARTDDPVVNLDYFLSLFADLYPAFEDRGVDWSEVTRTIRSKVAPESTPAELFALCREALDAIGRDGHIGMQGPGGERYSPARRLSAPMIRTANRERQVALIRERYLPEPRDTANGKILYGRIGDIGYLNVRAVEGMAAEDGIAAQRASLAAALDEIQAAFADTGGVVLDLRTNGGGYDALALMVAGLFAEGEHVGFSKRVRVQGTERFTEPRLFKVHPRENGLAGKPLRVLIGPGTASGAEILVMATLPIREARRVGAPTMGILSDTFVRELPNGWTVRLYSERYYTFDGGTFEATGLPPDTAVPFTVRDLDEGRDPVLEAAIDELRGAMDSYRADR